MSLGLHGGASMFSGSHLLTVDEKGRVAVPARFRQQLSEEHGAQLFITRAYNPCIEIYPAETFHALAEQIQNLEDRAAADRLKEVFIGHAVETELDKQGRMLLPQILRRHARLDSSAVLVGQINRFDIWSEDVWTQRFGDDSTEELAAAFTLLKR